MGVGQTYIAKSGLYRGQEVTLVEFKKGENGREDYWLADNGMIYRERNLKERATNG
jgi:hypothetical protein